MLQTAPLCQAYTLQKSLELGHKKAVLWKAVSKPDATGIVSIPILLIG